MPRALLALTQDDRVLGKPDAPITIIEYASLTCPHCAHFANEVLPKLKQKWIDTGKAKLILRDFPLDEAALRAAMLARCAPPDALLPADRDAVRDAGQMGGGEGLRAPRWSGSRGSPASARRSSTPASPTRSSRTRSRKAASTPRSSSASIRRRPSSSTARNSTGAPTFEAFDQLLSGLPKNHERQQIMTAQNHDRPAMQVERLRLAGFKSFVEPTELAIEPGLTGIVGPNGCGKSNLVEALRWVMGEASARRLRGGEMDDVIFAGSGSRPARNLAEVALTIDNSARAAPFAYNDERDDRGGAPDRARRRLVLSDQRPRGARPRRPAAVRRRRDRAAFRRAGRPGADRRADRGQADRAPAAARRGGRHRRAACPPPRGRAETGGRRGQSGAARRCGRNARGAARDAQETGAAGSSAIAGSASRSGAARRSCSTPAGGPPRPRPKRSPPSCARASARWPPQPPPRSADEREPGRGRGGAAAAAAGAGGGRGRGCSGSRMPARRSKQELGRVVAARAEAERRRAQIVADLEREAEHLADAEAALARLADERQALERAERGGRQPMRAEAAARVDAAARRRSPPAETGLQQMTEACAAGEARRAALDRQRRDLAERQSRLRGKAGRGRKTARAAAARDRAARGPGGSRRRRRRGGCRGRRCPRRGRSRRRDAGRPPATRGDGGRRRARQPSAILARLRAEAEALTRLLAPGAAAEAGGPSMLSLLQVPPGFEAAIGGAVRWRTGGAAAAATDPKPASAAAGWVELAPLADAALPAGAQPLAGEIGAPPALARRLAHDRVGRERRRWLAVAAAARGRPEPRRPRRQVCGAGTGSPGRRPVRRATAEQLRQRNRLAQLADEIAAAAAEAAAPATRPPPPGPSATRRRPAERAAVAALRAAEERLARARAAEAELARRGLAAETRLAAVGETHRASSPANSPNSRRRQREAERALALLPDPALARTALEAARAQAAAARRRESEARALLDRLAREAEARRQRLAAIGAEEASWQQAARRRRGAARGSRRAADARWPREIAELAGRPAAIAARNRGARRSAAAAAAAAARRRGCAGGGETRLREAADAARRADAALAEAREASRPARGAARGRVRGAGRLRAEIAERLDQSAGRRWRRWWRRAATRPRPIAGDLADLAARLDRLLRERDAMGPVNLLAEREAAEVAAQLAGLDHERGDLTEAIARLRRGIAALDQRGPQAARRRLRRAQRAFRRAVRPAVRRRQGGTRLGRRRATRSRPGSTSWRARRASACRPCRCCRAASRR